MRKFMSAAASVCLAASAIVAGAGVAHADTIGGDPCSEIDYTAATGTTIVLTGPCDFSAWGVSDGSPTVVYSSGGSDGQPLIWYQSVGRTGSTCEDGWTASYAEWPNDGKGGPTCDRSIVWGMGPGTGTGATSLSITINTPDDFVGLNSGAGNYITGCAALGESVGWYADHVIYNCPFTD